MEPLLWLAVPFVVTGAAAVVLQRRRRAAEAPRGEAVRDEQLRRMSQVLRREPSRD